jgi:Tat protein secretion system quality control protein TatD with DNase activity
MNPVENKFIEDFKRSDKSFSEKSTFLELFIHPFGRKYTNSELKEIFHSGINVGFQQGLYYNKPEYQRLQMNNNCKDENQKEFYEKFLKLCQEHNIRIIYHPLEGMMFEDLNK